MECMKQIKVNLKGWRETESCARERAQVWPGSQRCSRRKAERPWGLPWEQGGPRHMDVEGQEEKSEYSGWRSEWGMMRRKRVRGSLSVNLAKKARPSMRQLVKGESRSFSDGKGLIMLLC